MIPGIIISHGRIAEELKNAVELIVGPTRKLHAISNDGSEPDELSKKILKFSLPELPVFLFTDLRGGSCWRAAMIASKAIDESSVFTGVNLPMLISFVTKRSQLSHEELPAVVLEDAQRGLLLEKKPGG
ncbi:MAG: PTS sugar transporter subunit IIA [Calditrichia bacterium]